MTHPGRRPSSFTIRPSVRPRVRDGDENGTNTDDVDVVVRETAAGAGAVWCVEQDDQDAREQSTDDCAREQCERRARRRRRRANERNDE